ncbi:hypothetical protein LCGC14_2753810, partial [marine sediment metagenome]
SDPSFCNVPYIDWESFKKSYTELYVESATHFTGFGGGVFGGGGATRSWEEAPAGAIASTLDSGIIVVIRGDEGS